MIKLNVTFKNLLVILGWGVVIASIVLQRLYQEPLLLLQDYLLIFAISVLATMITVDARIVILGWIGSTLISILIMFICLTLPGAVDEVASYFVLEFLYAGAIVMIFRSVFPVAIITTFIGAVVGGAIGERLQQGEIA